MRVTGWAAPEGLRAELLPAVGLDETLSGVTGEGATLFVALSRLTGTANAARLGETVTVHAEGERELTVLWAGGPGLRVRWQDDGVAVEHIARD